MIVPILILTAIFLLGLGCGVAIWFVFKRRQEAKSKQPARETTPLPTASFRWKYIILPLVFLSLSIILSAYFYHLLPAEVAYHFKLDGTPDKWLSREITIMWVLIPQLILTLLAGGIIWGVTKLGNLFRQAESAWIKSGRTLSLMGNMVALPQLIVFFAMLHIFSYNSYQIRLMPMWLFLLIILGLATIALVVFLVLIISKARQHPRRTGND
jgi:uncharacterized membrane protein